MSGEGRQQADRAVGGMKKSTGSLLLQPVHLPIILNTEHSIHSTCAARLFGVCSRPSCAQLLPILGGYSFPRLPPCSQTRNPAPVGLPSCVSALVGLALRSR
jgi:hypothetical protein